MEEMGKIGMVVVEERCGGTFLRDQVVIFFRSKIFQFLLKIENLCKELKN